MKRKREPKIKCPSCGREYLPVEIFIPKSFFGKLRNGAVDRDITGKILDYDGTGMDTDEWYYCDNCNTRFRVCTNISFRTFVDNNKNVEKPYITKLKKATLFMNEE